MLERVRLHCLGVEERAGGLVLVNSFGIEPPRALPPCLKVNSEFRVPRSSPGVARFEARFGATAVQSSFNVPRQSTKLRELGRADRIFPAALLAIEAITANRVVAVFDLLKVIGRGHLPETAEALTEHPELKVRYGYIKRDSRVVFLDRSDTVFSQSDTSHKFHSICCPCFHFLSYLLFH